MGWGFEEVVQRRLLKVTTRYEKSTLLNVYAPVNPGERCIFLEKFASTLSDYLIVGGNVNCTVDDLDRNYVEPTAQSRKILKHLLSDACVSKHDNTRQYSQAHTRGNYISLARLDRFYCFEHHLQIFKSCFLCPVGFSDHFF